MSCRIKRGTNFCVRGTCMARNMRTWVSCGSALGSPAAIHVGAWQLDDSSFVSHLEPDVKTELFLPQTCSCNYMEVKYIGLKEPLRSGASFSKYELRDSRSSQRFLCWTREPLDRLCPWGSQVSTPFQLCRRRVSFTKFNITLEAISLGNSWFIFLCFHSM